ncbi:peptidase M24, structural domain-containing protein [Infundibulicybe gibba]|nr:peptidase M24, structural domain-containing protein [Infundibulicybe gibba]
MEYETFRVWPALHESHPHLLPKGELTPGIPATEYEARRRKLMEALPEGSVVLALASPVRYMSGNIFYKFRQASDFWYLTGFEEPNSAVILEKTSSSRCYTMTLFCTGKDAVKAQWDGASTSHEDACTIFNASTALPTSSLGPYLRALLTRTSGNIYTDANPARPRRALLTRLLPGGEPEAALEALGKAPKKPLAPEVAKLRAVKSMHEQAAMRSAADVSARAHAKTMRFAQPGMSEGALAAHFEYMCAMRGAQRPAYVPVVASGPNALIIHYTANNQLIRAGEMVLIDAGCEFNGYASDITRTFPATGTFGPAQRDLYSAVLATQKALVRMCAADRRISLHELHRLSVSLLGTELRQLGFEHPAAEMGVLYPHFLSHSIGAQTGRGMVVTIEPGLYVPPLSKFPKHFHNIGIRIEDEVLVGAVDPVVLSISAPKEIADVEGACQGLLGFGAF